MKKFLLSLPLLFSPVLSANTEEPRGPKTFLVFEAWNENNEPIGSIDYWKKNFRSIFVEHGFDPIMISPTEIQRYLKSGDLFIRLHIRHEKDEGRGRTCDEQLEIGYVYGKDIKAGGDKLTDDLYFRTNTSGGGISGYTRLPWRHKCTDAVKEHLENWNCYEEFRYATHSIDYGPNVSIPCVGKPSKKYEEWVANDKKRNGN